MEIEFKFQPGRLGSDGECVYWEAEQSLEYRIPTREQATLAEAVYRQPGLSPPRDFLVIADTLVMTFDGIDRQLTSLDAYTNKALWKPSERDTAPDVEGRGSLRISGTPPDDDRYSLDVIPRYELAGDDKWLRIVLSDTMPTAYYDVARNLIAGLQNDRIADLFLLNLKFL